MNRCNKSAYRSWKSRLLRTIVGLALTAAASSAMSTEESSASGSLESAGPSRFLKNIFKKRTADSAYLSRLEDREELENTVWTLEKALNRAMDENPEILSARNALDRQEGVYMQVRAGLYPKLAITGAASQRDKALLDRSPVTDPFVPSEQTAIADKSYSLMLQINFLIYDGRSIRNQTEVQRLLKKKLYYDAQGTAYRVAALVEQAFDSLLYRKNVLQVFGNTVDTFEKLLGQTSRRYDLGEVPELDELRVQTELMNARADSARAQSNLTNSEQYFRRILNLPEIIDARTGIPTGEGIVRKTFIVPFREAREMALDNRSDLLAARAQIEAAEAGVRAAVSEFQPKISGFADYRVNSSYFNQNITLDGWMVGISGTWNIFDAGANLGRLKANQAALRRSQMDADNLQYEIGSRLLELYSQLDQSESVITAQESSVSYGLRSVEQAQRMYEIGEATVDDVLNAELGLRRSQIKLQEAIFDNNVSVAQIQYLIGGPQVDHPFQNVEE